MKKLFIFLGLFVLIFNQLLFAGGITPTPMSKHANEWHNTVFATAESTGSVNQDLQNYKTEVSTTYAEKYQVAIDTTNIYTQMTSTYANKNDVAISSNSLQIQIDTKLSTTTAYATFLSTGVSQIIAGTNITITPSDGKGNVTINSSGGGSSLKTGTTDFRRGYINNSIGVSSSIASPYGFTQIDSSVSIKRVIFSVVGSTVGDAYYQLGFSSAIANGSVPQYWDFALAASAVVSTNTTSSGWVTPTVQVMGRYWRVWAIPMNTPNNDLIATLPQNLCLTIEYEYLEEPPQ